jgi:hypothetical protein
MTIFIHDALLAANGDTVNTVVMQVGGCGAASQGNGSSPSIASLGGSFIPIRLIRQN